MQRIEQLENKSIRIRKSSQSKERVMLLPEKLENIAYPWVWWTREEKLVMSDIKLRVDDRYRAQDQPHYVCPATSRIQVVAGQREQYVRCTGAVMTLSMWKMLLAMTIEST